MVEGSKVQSMAMVLLIKRQSRFVNITAVVFLIVSLWERPHCTLKTCNNKMLTFVWALSFHFRAIETAAFKVSSLPSSVKTNGGKRKSYVHTLDCCSGAIGKALLDFLPQNF